MGKNKRRQDLRSQRLDEKRRLKEYSDKLSDRERTTEELDLKFFDIDGLWNNRILGSNIRTSGQVKKICAEISNLHDFKTRQSGFSPFDSPDSVLKRCIYQLGIILFQLDEEDLAFEAAQKKMSEADVKTKDMKIDRRRIPKSAPDHAENPFYYLLYVVMPYPAPRSVPNLAETDYRRKVSKIANTRSRVSRELVYAYRHRVRPQYLIGFIYQIGGSKVIDQRLKGDAPRLSPQAKNNEIDDIKENWRHWALIWDEMWPWAKATD